MDAQSPTPLPAAGITPVPTTAEAIDQVNARHLGSAEPDVAPTRRRGNPNFVKGRPRAEQFSAGSRQATISPAGIQAERPPIDKELVKKSVASLCKVVDSIVARHIYRAAYIVSKEDKQFSVGMVQEVQMTTDEQELIAGLSAEVCERWQLLGQYAPELLLAICVIGYASRPFFATMKLREFAEQQKKKASAASPQTN